MDWQIWAVIGMAIICVACIEYAVRIRIRQARHILEHLRAPSNPMTSKQRETTG
jgi:hypothetical protein